MILVSVIIPTYNRSKLLSRAIKSVLDQSYQDFELIVVDDCSSDDTKEIVAGFKDARVHYIKLEKNTGGSLIPRQTGQKYASGKYIAVLDDDSYWVDKSKLALQVFYLESHSECMLVGTDAVAINGNGKVVVHHNYTKTFNEIKDKMLMHNNFFHSSVMYRRKIADDIGGYHKIKDGCYTNFSDDYELWLRMGLIGELVNLPIYGVGYIYASHYKTLGLKDRVKFEIRRMKLIRKYKKYYPNYLTAIIFSFVVMILELPLLYRIKMIIRNY